MNPFFTRSHIHRIHLWGTLLVAGSLSLPSAAQGFKDSLLLDFFGTEAAIDNWKKSQKNTYSFNHLLQGPKVAKHFNNKKFGDHLFLEGGTQLFLDMSQRTNTSLGDIKPWANVAIGDWVTPLHGWRAGLLMGKYTLNGKESSIFGGGIDYLLNINAVAAQNYEKRKRIEFYGVAGIDAYSSKLEDNHDMAFGFHLGLRAQAFLSPYTYIYLEPRIGANSKELVHANTWHKSVLSASALAGVGYALAPLDVHRKEEYPTGASFLDNTFFSLSGGPSMLFNLGSIGSTSEQIGGSGFLHFGKWFDPSSALRIGLGISNRRQPKDNNMKALSASVGYMWNMHNTFGGYNPDRRFWINAVADLSAHFGTSGHGKKGSLGIGAGLQPNVRIADGIDLFLEPRIDAYTKDYASSVGKTKDIDLTASVLAGIAFHQGIDSKNQLLRNDYFENKTYYDHLFFDLGFGGFLPLANGLGDDTFSHLGIGIYAGLGKWFNATSGLRLWTEFSRLEDTRSDKSDVMNFGLDYLWNLSNALHGYSSNRRCELIASAGVNGMSNLKSGSFYVGANLGLKGMVHVNDMLSLYLEPQARIYGPNVLPGSSFVFKKTDALAAMMAGVELRMNGYEPSNNIPQFEEDDNNGFFSLAAGFGTTANAPGTSHNYGFAGRASYGNWWNPVSGWRANISGLAKPKEPYRYASLTLGADYMADFTTLAYGYNPDRIVNIRGIAGVDMGVDFKSELEHWTHFVSNVHIGGQMAFAVGSKNELYVEPQVGYVIGGKPTIENKERVLGMVMFGLNHKMNGLNSHKIDRNDDFESETPYDHMFVELGAGGTFPASNEAGSQLLSHFGPSINAGIGKWFNATSGLRLWGEMAKLEDVDNKRIDAINFGVDYLWNVSNALSGYDPNRIFELVGSVGVNGMSRLKNNKFYVGANAGLKGLWHLNDLTALYMEPQLRMYGPNAMPNSAFMFKKTDLMAGIMAGVQFTMNGYRPSAYQAEFEENERNSFFSAAAGTGTSADAISAGANYGIAGRMSYGHWFTPVSAWRMNLTGLAKPKSPYRYAQLTVGADYISDLSAQAYGYNPDRIVNVRALAGINIGADYKANSDGRAHFLTDVHFGGQLAFAVGNKNELYIEPQMGYVIGGKRTRNNNQRVTGTVLLGLNHKLKSLDREHLTQLESDQDEFVSVSLGTGLHTQSILARKAVRHKMTIDFDMSYGRWLNSISGIRLGLSNTSVKLQHKLLRKNILSFHADYMFNMLNLAGNESHLDTDWVLNGMAGFNLNIGCNKKLDTTFAPGAQVGVELGYKVTPHCEIFAEPTGVVMGKKIWNHTSHPAVIQGRLMFGTKYTF